MIRTVLVANRGEIARRVFRTCREMGIRTVAVYSDADVDAPFVAEADVAVRLGAPEPSESYLAIDKILAAASATGADAIHPGYGFLAENADFARACADAGVIFIGPGPEAIESMGSKIESKRIMDTAGVATLPSIEVEADTDLAAAAGEIGYPVLVKASAGGGGKGMRIVEGAGELDPAVQGAIREAEAAFGDGTVFLEKYLTRPRHIEVQVFGDVHGRVISMGERECSIQRRHQKVVEEAPSPAVSADLRARLGEAAVNAATAVSYVGAGTVEFLLDADGKFYFLEMNTRLQVEHPVTEMVLGADLVRMQIEVAEGLPISPALAGAGPTGHAVEVRLYAEDPANNFLPATGTLEIMEIPSNVRCDAGPESGSQVSIFYDPMLAKIIAHGATRNDAIRTLSTALRASRIHGVTTNVSLLIRVLEHPDFIDGSIDTAWLESMDMATFGGTLASSAELESMALAASVVGQASRRTSAAVLTTLPSGYRNNPSQLTVDQYQIGDRTLSVGYRLTEDVVQYAIDGAGQSPATLLDAHEGAVRLRVNGVDRVFTVSTSGDRVFVDTADASVDFVKMVRLPVPESAHDPGSLLSPMPGKVIRVEVSEGDAVASGAALVVVEAMKMEHTVTAPYEGTVASITVTRGDQVEADQVLAVVDPI